MFLAGKVEDSPRPLQDVILMSYEIRFKKDPIAVQKIKQKHVFEAEKERVLLGEWLVLTTLGFDFNVHHPYKPLGATLRKLGMAKHPLAQVAWNFVNDGLRTSLCLQYKPHHVAAGAIFLATKFLKIKLNSEGDKLWWQEFEVTPRQLEDVSNQMLELYEQDKKGMSSRMSDPSSSTGPNTPKKGTASTDLPDVAGCPCPVLPPGQMKPELLEDKKKYSKIVEAVTGDMTEAHSSLEEGENMAESKPATFEIPGTAAFLTNTSRTSSKGQHSAVKVSKVVLRRTEKSLKQTPVYRDKLNMDVRESTGKPCRARGEVSLDTYPLMKPTNEEVHTLV